MLDICGSQALFIPQDNCGDCDGYAQRIKALEQSMTSLTSRFATVESKVGNKGNVVISKTDANGDTVTATVLASVE